MAEGVHVHQAYCVSVISDKINPIQNVLDVSGSWALTLVLFL